MWSNTLPAALNFQKYWQFFAQTFPYWENASEQLVRGEIVMILQMALSSHLFMYKGGKDESSMPTWVHDKHTQVLRWRDGWGIALMPYPITVIFIYIRSNVCLKGKDEVVMEYWLILLMHLWLWKWYSHYNSRTIWCHGPKYILLFGVYRVYWDRRSRRTTLEDLEIFQDTLYPFYMACSQTLQAVAER